jgi:hypothetical protein
MLLLRLKRHPKKNPRPMRLLRLKCHSKNQLLLRFLRKAVNQVPKQTHLHYPKYQLKVLLLPNKKARAKAQAKARAKARAKAPTD